MDGTHPKNYLIDMDGVLLRGAAPIPGATETSTPRAASLRRTMETPWSTICSAL